MRGEARHDLLAGMAYVGPGSAEGALYDLRAGYPALVEDAATRVRGEIYEALDLDARFSALDAYEGCDPSAPADSLYRRTVRSVCREDGARVDAWVYSMPAEAAPRLIANGARLVTRGQWRDDARRGNR